MTPDHRARLLQEIWRAGVNAVRGDTAVGASLDRNPIPRPDLILAVGKAAVAMTKPAFARFGPLPTLVVTKHGHVEPDLPFQVLEAAHPVPDASSLTAGARLLTAVRAAPPGAHLLLLVSGGASALAEAPRPGVTLADITALNRSLLASGKDIATMNAERTLYSQIKGGGLLDQFRGARVTVLAISDTRGDLIDTIGSGVGLCRRADLTVKTRIVASNTVARLAVAARARELGLTVQVQAETLYQDVETCAGLILAGLGSAPGLYVWGGEPTVVLPPNPGRGGRNQALALRVAQGISGMGAVSVLVAGTDGSDGPTTAAGGLVDGATWDPTARTALAAADSGTFLDRRGALFTTGPTGTNVMDLALALRG